MDAAEILNLFYLAFDGLKSIISTLLFQTLLKNRPDIADSFATTISLLITLTAIYIILVFISSAKKVVGIILALGWVFLLLSIGVALIT